MTTHNFAVSIKTLTAALLIILTTACSDDRSNHYSPGSFAHAEKQLQTALKQTANTRDAKGIILFVGDGMSIATVTASRIYAGQKIGLAGEEHQLSFEQFPFSGLVKTYNTNQQTPDSAGTMTAMLTGSKTKAGILSINTLASRADQSYCSGYNLETLLELAEEQNWATGIVTTTSITHATPAAAYAHSPERDWESDADLPEPIANDKNAKANISCRDIARQLIEFDYGNGIEVALGGGATHFLPISDAGKRKDGRNLIDEWKNNTKKSAFVSTSAELAAIDTGKTKQLLGLFSPSHMDFEVDRDTSEQGQPSLTTMVETAVTLLKKHKRFLLIVESGRIDHAHHVGNAYRALEETVEFDRAIARTKELVDAEQTLMIVTADHSHTMTIAGYPTRGNPILGFVKGNDNAGNAKTLPTLAQDKKPYTTLSYANGPGYYNKALDPNNPYARYMLPATSGRHTAAEDNPEAAQYHQEANVPLQAETHAGDDIAVYAQGPWAHLLTGVIEQNYIYHVMKHAADF